MSYFNPNATAYDLRIKMAGDSSKPVKVLVIGNYPPPMCGWAIQTYLVTAELRRRGQVLRCA